MARGFESKSVQDQQLSAEAARDARRKPKKSAEEINLDKKREGLEMSRRRILQELKAATSDRRREQLRAALAHLDDELTRVSEQVTASREQENQH